MAKVRFSHLDDFVLKDDGKVGIQTSLPSAKVEVAGTVRAGNLKSSSGITTFISLDGYVNQDMEYSDNVTIDSGESGTLSGEIVIGAGLTMTVGTGATTGQGSIKSLKVSNTFNPPIGSSDERPSAPKPGALYYNKDFKTIEYWDGNFWRQVDNVEKGGGSRAVMGGGSSNVSPATNYMTQLSYKDISTLGNFETFGDLGYNVYGAEGVCDGTRGLMMGGYANPGNTNMISYITVQSQGNATDFGYLTRIRENAAAATNNTRIVFVAGEAPGVYVNICDFVTINTGGAAQDFGDIGWAMGDMGMCSATNGGLGGF